MKVPATEQPKPATRAAEIRQELGLTQTVVAAAAGISASHLSLIETGAIQNPNLRTLKKIAAALNVSLEALFGSEAA